MTTRQLPAGSTPGTGTFGPVRTAVFPAAGFGTRMLPATKSVPKEMLTVVDRPVIQYGVEEAVASGISKIVVITAQARGQWRITSTQAVSSNTCLSAKAMRPIWR